MMTWLFNSPKEKISGSVMFLTTAKEMLDTLKVIYGNEKSPSRVFEIYECLYDLKQGDRSVPEFYGELKDLIDELEMHQPAVTDVATLWEYRQDLAVSKFLSGLNSTLRSQVQGQILGGEYSHVDGHILESYAGVYWIRCFICTIHSVVCLISGRGRGCGCDFGGRERGSVGRERGSYGSRQSASEKAPPTI